MAGTDLPEDVLVRIFRELDVKTLGRASLVCKEWARVITTSEAVWHVRLSEDFVTPSRGGRETYLRHGLRYAMRWSRGKTPAKEIYRTQIGLRKLPERMIRGDHDSWIWDVDPVGEYCAVSCSDGGILSRWESTMTESGEAVQCVGKVSIGVALTDVVVHKNAETVVTCGRDGSYRVCDLTATKSKVRHVLPSDFVVRMALADDLLLCAAMDSHVRVVRGMFSESGTLRESHLKGHSDWVRSVGFVHQCGDPYSLADDLLHAPTVDRALSSADDSCLCIFDLEEERLLTRMQGPLAQAVASHSSFDGRLAASGYSNGQIVIFDLRTGLSVISLEESSSGNMHSVIFTKDGLSVMGGAFCRSSNTEGRIPIFDLRRGTAVRTVHMESCISSVRLTDSGNKALICSGDGLYCWFLDK